eukprot:10407-Heterococcus_DN1.PRE.2
MLAVFVLRVLYDDAMDLSNLLELMSTCGASIVNRFHLNGKQGCSCHAVIGQCGLLTDEYHDLSTSLHAKYYPLEVDRSLSLEERIKFMVEWVEQSHAAMLTSGLTRSKLIAAVADATIAFRDGHDVLLRHLEALSIPLLIFSAGIADVLEEVFKQHSEAPLPQHAHIVSNRMVFNEQSGALEGFTEDLFHVFNKQAFSIQHAPYFQADGIGKRHNVILVGDSLGDVHMATKCFLSSMCTAVCCNMAHIIVAVTEPVCAQVSADRGIAAKEVLSIAFLNDRVDDRFADYIATFDVVIIGESAGLHYACKQSYTRVVLMYTCLVYALQASVAKQQQADEETLDHRAL